MPWAAVLSMCAQVVGTACVMATQSIALAADGAFQLVRALGSESVYVPLDARTLAAWMHQGGVVGAVRIGVTTPGATFLSRRPIVFRPSHGPLAMRWPNVGVFAVVAMTRR